MAINEHLTKRVKEILNVIPDIEIEENKMFRGITFMVNKKMLSLDMKGLCVE